MRRIVGVLAAVIVTLAIAHSSAFAANSVVAESKSFPINTAACTVGVYVSNDVDIVALVLALQLKTVSGGAYMGGTLSSGNFKWEAVPGGRVDNSPLGPAGANWPAANITNRKYAAPSGTCAGHNDVFQTATALPDVNSPDGFLHATVSTGDEGIGEEIVLTPGSDPQGSPSFRFVFPVNGNEGTFMVDSCCVTPANINQYVDRNTDVVTPTFTPGIITLTGDAVKELETGIIPQDYELEQNYPNPFNAGTVIRFKLPTDGDVKIDVYNILGRKVRTLVNEFRVAGTHQTDWDGRSDDGTVVATGVYFYRIQAGDFTSTRKMVLMK
ncbi:MAG TPA: T9SS type A sorting domain-containing protein [bacterium]|nr:T9SS type A sorting domain-containing protein [bacterium]